jgi:uncharacterized protein
MFMVLYVDMRRLLIGLTLRLAVERGVARGARPAGNDARPGNRDARASRQGGASKPASAPANSALADALLRAKQR